MEERPKQGSKRRIWVLGGLALLLALGWSVRALSYQVTNYRYYSVPTGSMVPAISPGDSVRVELGSQDTKPRRHEVWAFAMPAAASGTVAVKRVIGLPGETVAVANGQVLVDGKPLAEPYLKTPPTYTMAPRTLGPDEFFLLGDNRNISNDSHLWGPLKQARFIGRVRLRYWPPSRFGGL